MLRKLALKEIDKYTKRQLLGKYSCAIKDLLTIFFNYYPPVSTDKPLTQLHSTEKEYTCSQATGEEGKTESNSNLSASEVDTESEDDRPERVQSIDPYTTISIPATTKAASEPIDVRTSDPCQSTDGEETPNSD